MLGDKLSIQKPLECSRRVRFNLNFSKGTMIVIKKKTETGWWQGEQVGHLEATKSLLFSLDSLNLSQHPKKEKKITC